MSEFSHLVDKAKIVIGKLEKELACYQVLPAAKDLHDELVRLFGEAEKQVVAEVEPTPAPEVVAAPEAVVDPAPATEEPAETVEEPVEATPTKAKSRSAAAKSE